MGGSNSVAAGPRPVIVVVGAGLVGTILVKEARKQIPQARLIVIDPKSYYENNVGAPRALVAAAFQERTSKPHSFWLPGAVPYGSVPQGQSQDVEFVVGRAVSLAVADKTLTVEQLAASLDAPAPLPAPVAVTIKYDYLVIASGTRYDALKASQVTLAERQAYLKHLEAQIKAARHIVVVGGGPVGIDLVAEIQSVYGPEIKNKQKRLTLVQRNASLVPDFPKNGQIRIRQILEEAGVQVLTGQTVANEPAAGGVDEKGAPLAAAGGAGAPRTLTTSAGVALDGVDLVLRATGAISNTEWLHAALALDSRKRVVVQPTLQATGHSDVFVVGDAASLPEGQLILNGANHPAVVVANLKALIAGGGKATGLKTYSPGQKRPLSINTSAAMVVFAWPCCCECLWESPAFANMKTGIMTKPPEIVPKPTDPAAAR